jgi:hypothetical protein
MDDILIEITVFAKHGGPLTKLLISLGADGTLCSDGSECVMAKGTARRNPTAPIYWPLPPGAPRGGRPRGRPQPAA